MNLARLLQEMGVAVALAFTISSLVGSSQIVGRRIDYFYMQRWHPLISTRWTAVCHPIAAVLLMIFSAPMALVFVLLHGVGNGILIIARGNLPLVVFGSNGYGRRQDWLMMPAKFAQAAAPFLFGLALTECDAKYFVIDLGARPIGFDSTLLDFQQTIAWGQKLDLYTNGTDGDGWEISSMPNALC